jgi:hypothetical protein
VHAMSTPGNVHAMSTPGNVHAMSTPGNVHAMSMQGNVHAMSTPRNAMRRKGFVFQLYMRARARSYLYFISVR